MGFLVLSGHFIDYEPLSNFVDKDATQWYEIIAGFAAFLGVLNLLKLHFSKISYKKKNWQYSILTLISFFIMIFFGFMYKGDSSLSGDSYIDSNNNNKYDHAEKYIDQNNNGMWDADELFLDIDYGVLSKDDCSIIENSKWYGYIGYSSNKDFYLVENIVVNDDSTYIKAACGNGIKGFDEQFQDILGNFKYDEGENFIDSNNDGKWNYPESFIDNPDGNYTEPVRWGAHLKNERSIFYWVFNNIYLPLGATMFALLAFFVASASYRAFRIRNFEATLLLISGVLLMLGRVPVGALIPWYLVIIMYVVFIFILFGSLIENKRVYFFVFIILNAISITAGLMLGWHLQTPSFLSVPLIQEWIFSVPATAGSRAIMIGIALGTVAQSFRIITGREKTILGD
tara:strand:- start:45132 stop:46328 length:1197 start_codon:yes stop_codon:yes gene_type:complete